jgi:hypothetical protein
MDTQKDRPCPYCGRSCRDCWVMPCLEVERIIHQGKRFVVQWLQAAGYTVRKQGRDLVLS